MIRGRVGSIAVAAVFLYSALPFDIHMLILLLVFNIPGKQYFGQSNWIQILKNYFASIKNAIIIHPALMKGLNVYLPHRVEVSEDWNHEAYFVNAT